MVKRSTKEEKYTKRLSNLETKKWKTLIRAQQLYQWNLKRLRPGVTLDIGCGIGRYLKNLPSGSIGIDHNKHSVEYASQAGLLAYTIADFKKSGFYKKSSFDSLLLSHVLEHLSFDDGLKLIQEYTSLLRPGGKIIIFCPQEKGYASDQTHITFLDADNLTKMIELADYKLIRSGSFPFPRSFGKIFKYNEFVIVGQK